MTSPDPSEAVSQLSGFASRKTVAVVPDRIGDWVDRYLALAVTGVRSPEVAPKISLHLERFRVFLSTGTAGVRNSPHIQGGHGTPGS